MSVVSCRRLTDRAAVQAGTNAVRDVLADPKAATKCGLTRLRNVEDLHLHTVDWLGAQAEVIFDAKGLGAVTVTLNARHGVLWVFPVAVSRGDFTVLDVQAFDSSGSEIRESD